MTEWPVYDRYALAPGATVDGPGADRGAREHLRHRRRADGDRRRPLNLVAELGAWIAP